VWRHLGISIRRLKPPLRPPLRDCVNVNRITHSELILSMSFLVLLGMGVASRNAPTANTRVTACLIESSVGTRNQA
jgi:hypothetical protein